MRRRGLVVVALGLLAIGLLGLAASIATRTQSFSLGVTPSVAVLELAPGATLCQGPIDVVEDFERVTVTIGTFTRPGQPLDVRVRDAATRKVLAGGRVNGGYADNSEQEARVGRVAEGESIAVCVTNRGTRRVAAYGNADAAHVPSSAALDGKAKGVDASMRFLYDKPRSLLSLAPKIVDRATLFAPSWLSPAMLWILFGFLVFAVPALLVYALTRAEESPAAGPHAPGSAPDAPDPPPAAELQAGAPVEP